MSEEILIPAATLAEFLADAENAELMIKENAGVRQVPGKLLRKRRRQSMPAEELDEVKEERFKKEEERAEKRARRGDEARRP